MARESRVVAQVLFVPSGWWHCVLNVELSVAVTQNFLNAAALDALVAAPPGPLADKALREYNRAARTNT